MAIQQARLPFYRTVVAQAQRIEIVADAIHFAYAPVHRLLKEQVEQNKPWLEGIAEQVAGRRLSVRAELTAGAAAPPAAAGTAPPAEAVPKRPERDLRSAVLADETVQALLGIFPAEIRSVEEIDRGREGK